METEERALAAVKDLNEINSLKFPNDISIKSFSEIR